MIRCFSFQDRRFLSVATPFVTTEMSSGRASGSTDPLDMRDSKNQHENSVNTVIDEESGNQYSYYISMLIRYRL